MHPPIYIYVNKILEGILANKGVGKYAPAYDGESAGLDLYHAGEVNRVSANAGYPSPYLIRTKPGSGMIPTGLHVAIPKGYVGIIKGRGSQTKTNLNLRAGVIDPGYTGEVWVNVQNLGSVHHTFKPGQKLPFQLVVVPVNTLYQKVSKKHFDEITANAKRKTGQVGSSD